MGAIIESQDTLDLGTAIQKLINQNLSEVNTIYLAKVEAVSDNKVDISPLFNGGAIITNCLIAQPYSNSWHISYKVEAGDIGLALVSQCDISTYKSNGAGGSPNTNRKHDLIDSIFMPLSLFNHKADSGLTITNAGGDCVITLSDDGISIKGAKVSISASDISIKGENPLEIGAGKPLIECFNVILDNLENAIKGGIINPTTQTIQSLPMFAAQVATMKQTIQEVLK